MLAYSSSQHVCYQYLPSMLLEATTCNWKLKFFCKYYVWFHFIFHFLVSLRKLQIYAMPVFDIYETLLVKKLNFMPCFRLRLITCTPSVGEWLMLFLLWMSYHKGSSTYFHVLIYLGLLQLWLCSLVCWSLSSVVSLDSWEDWFLPQQHTL